MGYVGYRYEVGYVGCRYEVGYVGYTWVGHLGGIRGWDTWVGYVGGGLGWDLNGIWVGI